MSDILRVQWTITPQIAPRPWLNCNRCGDTRPFASSGKIRMNANGRRIDAWLIYKCVTCENSWNRPLLERRNVGDVDPAMLHALQNNDPDLVRRIAFDTEDLKRRAAYFEEFAAVEVLRTTLSEAREPVARLEISMVAREPTCLRMDRLLASELNVSRARIQALSDKDRLTLFPHGARMLRRPVRDGMRVMVEVSAEDGADMRRAGGGETRREC